MPAIVKIVRAASIDCRFSIHLHSFPVGSRVKMTPKLVLGVTLLGVGTVAVTCMFFFLDRIDRYFSPPKKSVCNRECGDLYDTVSTKLIKPGA